MNVWLQVVTGACVAASLLGGREVAAQTYPAKPITIINPFVAGGGGDIAGRTIGSALSQALGQSVVIESRPGGGGSIGLQAVVKAAPDGYTLGIGPSGTLTILANLIKLPFDTVADITPISGLTHSSFLIIVPAASQILSVADLIRRAKAAPGTLNFGSNGIASTQHLAGELFKSTAGIDIAHVPYKGGAEATTAVIGGQVDLAIVGQAGIAAPARAGRLRVIAVTGREKLIAISDAPTVAQSGYPDYEVTGWLSLVGPRNMPAAIVRRLNAEVVNALRSPEVQARMSGGGSENPYPTTPEELGRAIRTDFANWGKVIRTAGNKIDN